ncbi:hypothetical protein ABDK00_001695 [Niabella insulamsoli]|uniref:hypothetical protein n=1 Tax=Niabella insulamsoli TaxID=3144874 RepID=UPI0031FBB76D
MDKLQLNNIGGLMAYQDVLAALQQYQSTAILQLLKAFGDNVIINGCEIAGSVISPGVILLNGEVLPFAGGENLTHVAVQEVITQKPYKDGIERNLYVVRTAIPAAAGTLLTDFFRIDTIKQLTQKINKKSDSYSLNDSTTLATSKAVYDSMKRYVIAQGWSRIVGVGGNDTNSTYTTSAGEFGLINGISNPIALRLPLTVPHTNYSVILSTERQQPSSTDLDVLNSAGVKYIQKTNAVCEISMPFLTNSSTDGVVTSVFWSVINNQSI